MEIILRWLGPASLPRSWPGFRKPPALEALAQDKARTSCHSRQVTTLPSGQTPERQSFKSEFPRRLDMMPVLSILASLCHWLPGCVGPLILSCFLPQLVPLLSFQTCFLP